MSDFSSNLRRLRKRAGLSQDALAEKLSVTRQTVSSWERGNSYPDLDMLVRISDASRPIRTSCFTRIKNAGAAA